MSEPIKLPPIPEHVQILFRDDMRTYARLAVEQNTEALRAECDALRADAERYRWLRHGDNDEPCLHFSAECKAGTDTVWLVRDVELDAAIDAARAALKEAKE